MQVQQPRGLELEVALRERIGQQGRERGVEILAAGSGDVKHDEQGVGRDAGESGSGQGLGAQVHNSASF